jgi:tRNA-Thr(GGU) m(6)t(6)A37 methyltransferase TsaA
MSSKTRFTVEAIGFVRSSLKRRKDAPRFGNEGAPEAWVEILPAFVEGLQGITDGLPGLTVGGEIILLTWFHQSRRDVLKVHPRRDKTRPLTGVFATRSPDRPNPIGLHRVTVFEVAGNRLRVGPLEAIDGTPVVDIKPVVLLPSDA